MNPEVLSQLNQIVQRVVAAVPTRAIYLFGSYARGDQHEGSDLDIYVLTDDKKHPMDYILEIAKAIRPVKRMPVDVLAMPFYRFEERSTQLPTLEYTVATEGIKIYG